MSTSTGIILHIISTLIMFGSFALMLGGILTNSWKGVETPANGTDVYQGLMKFCISKDGNEFCEEVSKHDNDNAYTTHRNVSRALLSAAIFLSFLAFGLSVIALCKRARTIHVRYQVCVILSIIVALGCGIGCMVNYSHYFGGGMYTSSVLTSKYGWRYSWKCGWAGSIILIFSLLIAIYDTCTFPKGDYEGGF